MGPLKSTEEEEREREWEERAGEEEEDKYEEEDKGREEKEEEFSCFVFYFEGLVENTFGRQARVSLS